MTLAIQINQSILPTFLAIRPFRDQLANPARHRWFESVTVPNYRIKAGDAEAVANAALVGMPRNPTVTLSATGPQVNYGTGATTVVYSVSNNSILRTENGQVTTIASSTDQLLPQSTDVELANTEYANTTVTFMPIFTIGGSAAARTGTTLYTTSYLRNKRRG